jgi:hypothetical protein
MAWWRSQEMGESKGESEQYYFGEGFEDSMVVDTGEVEAGPHGQFALR